MKGYFDGLCASKESQLYGAPCNVEDNETVKGLRQAIADDPEDSELYIKLGDALSYQLRYIEAISAYTRAIGKMPDSITGYQKRGGRCLTTLQLARAYEDFKTCASFGRNAEIELLSGLTAYLLGRHNTAKEHFANWIDMAGDDTEELVAVIFWYMLSCVKSRDSEGMTNILKLYSPDMYFGHHTAYKCGIDLFRGDITPEEAMKAAEAADGDDRDLEYSMITYAVANYEYWKGNASRYVELLDAILLRDTFWAGFASLAALNDRHSEVARDAERHGKAMEISERLGGFFADNPKMALAFSGGTDSSLILCAAKRAGCDIRPYFVKSPFQPQFELDDARQLCKELDIELTVLPVDVLEDGVVVANPSDRCYHCKRRIFSLILKTAARDGYELVIDGTNASDDPNDRPGMRALHELGVRSPLAECNITKAQVRELSRAYGLFTADKPAYACLATRIPTGQAITADILVHVERAEGSLFDMGFTDFRVRVLGSAARIQLPEAQMAAAFERREEIRQAIAEEFSSVLLDLNTR